MSTELFHGFKGIASGTILIFGVTFTLLPMNRHNPLLDALFIVGMLLALMMILIGVCTLGEKGNSNIGAKITITLVVAVMFVFLCWLFVQPWTLSNVITTIQINNGTTTTLIYPKPPITTTEYIVNDGVTTTEYIHH